MHLLSIEPRTKARPSSDDTAQLALAGVIGCIGSARFGATALAQLNRWMPLCWLSIYRLFDDAPPTIHAAGSFGVRDGTHDAWRVYRSSLYRRDETFAAAREQVRHGRAVLTHWHAKDLRPAHRAAIYTRNALRERLSIVGADGESGLLALNLYRHEEQTAFTDNDLDRVSLIAQPLLACARLQVSWRPDRAAAGSLLDALPRREREVCERMLKGWTYDGIAADLEVAPATVKTYRDRAFERLGIHHRNELFALVSDRGVRAP